MIALRFALIVLRRITSIALAVMSIILIINDTLPLSATVAKLTFAPFAEKKIMSSVMTAGVTFILTIPTPLTTLKAINLSSVQLVVILIIAIATIVKNYSTTLL